jgi:hypothetical protein
VESGDGSGWSVFHEGVIEASAPPPFPQPVPLFVGGTPVSVQSWLLDVWIPGLGPGSGLNVAVPDCESAEAREKLMAAASAPVAPVDAGLSPVARARAHHNALRNHFVSLGMSKAEAQKMAYQANPVSIYTGRAKMTKAQVQAMAVVASVRKR